MNEQIIDARTPPVAVWQMLESLKGDELVKWRIKDVANRASLEQRNLADLPMPYGWFVLCYSDELGIGDVKPLDYFEQQLVLWRGEDGIPRVIDAYCRHLGAHMGYGGRVNGNDLECPFHAWTYDKEGIVTNVPYASCVPNSVKRKAAKQWPVQEKNKQIWVWYHPDNEPPSYEVEEFSQIHDPDWTAFERYEWIVHGPLQNMAENGVDTAHFKYIHGTMEMPDYDIKFDGIYRSATLKSKMGTPKGEIDGEIAYGQLGAGQSWVKFSGLSETLLITGVTPIARDKTHVRFAFIQPKAEAEGEMAGLARAIKKDICKQLDQDKVVWDRQKYIERPSVCDGDGPILPFRNYYAQFYPGTKGKKTVQFSASSDEAEK